MSTNKTKSRFVNHLGTAACAAIYLAFAGLTSTSMADDTSIYVNRFPTSGIPNILFVIDSSGSMTATVPSINRTRMDAVKEAMELIINREGNVKMGLARFHYYLGGPIIFPITSLNDNPPFLNDDVAVATIAESSDDAEEVGGVVSLTDPSLELTVISAGSSDAVAVWESNPLSPNGNDDDEIGASGAGINSVDLDIAGNTTGINFKNVQVPRDAVILSAEVTFTARTTLTGTAHTVIRGHDTDNPGNFSSLPLADRLTQVTAAGVPWSNISAVSAGDTVTSPNLRSIVQEIVSRPGYPASGGGNIALIFENGTGNREFWSYDGNLPEGPRIRITFAQPGVTNVVRRIQAETDDAEERAGSGTTDTNDARLDMTVENGNQQIIGLRFTDVQIPPNATILHADISMTVRDDDASWIQPADFMLWGELSPDAAAFSNNSTNGVTGRTATTANVLWDEVKAPRSSETLQTPDLSAIVQEIVGAPSGAATGWAAGNAMMLAIQEGPGPETGARSICSQRATVNDQVCPEGAEFRPTLNLWYALPDLDDDDDVVRQTVGLRFDNVTVPQGAEITKAFIEFQAGAVSTEPGSGLTIAVEDSANAAPYTGATNDITGRSYYGNTSWPLTAWEAVDAVKSSVDISDLVENVTDRADWCGGNAMAFRITSSDAKMVAHAFDAAPSKAPILRVQFDTSALGAGQGCVKQRTVSLITDGNGDVEELGDGSVRLFDDALDLDPNGNYVGFRFKDIQVPRGASIIDAFLTFSSYQNDAGAARLQIQVQPHPNPPVFTDANRSVSDRVDGAPAANWDIAATGEDWVDGEEYTTPAVMSPNSLKDLVQPIIDGTVVVDGQQWAPGNALVFVVRNTGAFDRDIASVNLNSPRIPKRPAELVIEWEANLGDVNFPALNTRQKMIQAVNEIQPRGATPTTDTLFEAASYFEGRPVHWGRTRGAGNSYEPLGPTNNTDLDSQIVGWTDDQLLRDGEFGRMSHPATYAPASTIVRSGTCTILNPNDPACRTEHLDNASAPEYVSPFTTASDCEKGFIILLSDGRANRNSSRDLIRNLTGAQSCDARIPTIDTAGNVVSGSGNQPFVLRDPTSDELCAVDLAAHLFAQDYIPGGGDVDFTKNNVKTFTVGLDLDLNNASNKQAAEYLRAIAFAGQGGDFSNPSAETPYGTGYFDAGNAADLSAAFGTILTQIVDETTSFVAPGLSINAFNRLFNREDVYFSLFKPAETQAWEGNMKKFRLCTVPPGTPSASCEFGEIIDEDGNPAVFDDPGNLDTFGTLKETANGFWSPVGKRPPVIDEGGAGELIPTWTSRVVYVNTSSATVPAPDYLNDPVQSQGTALHKLTVSGGTSDVGADPATNPLKQALVNAGNCGPSASPDDACLDETIEWMAGRKFANDKPRSGNENDADRWAFADPMHSRPLVLTFGRVGTDNDQPISKILVGTNDGVFRLINEHTGVEEWVIYPNEMLNRVEELKINATGPHIFGMDGTAVGRILDANADGIIDPADGDFVHVYIGMRRGGHQILAYNVTPNAKLDTNSERSAVDTIVPELLWRIDNTQADFARLGQTWSTPRPVRILGPNGPQTVLIFAGGYSAAQDGQDNDGTPPDGGDFYRDGTSGDSEGNAIYIVDANTGQRLWWVSSDSTADKVLADMNVAMPAPITTFDSNGDGFVDRVYAVDLRGQIFRVDIEANATNGDFSSSTAGTLARLGDIATNADRRKFFYAPTVASVDDSSLGGGKYELIGVISGNRAQPQAKDVQDRVYGIRDYLIAPQKIDNTASNYPACNPLQPCTAGTPINHSSLINVTEASEFVLTDADDPNDPNEPIDNLRLSRGWYFDLEGTVSLTGEKGFSPGTVLDGKMFFTTYLPPENTTSSDSCSVADALGFARFYAVDFFTGAPEFEFFDGGEGFTKADRYKSLGAGPSADVVPAYLEPGVTLIVPTGAGALPQDPNVSETIFKSFWFQER